MSNLINRDKLITVLEELENEYRIEDDFNSAFAVEYATGKVKQQPLVDTERHAHWDVIAGIKDKKGIPVKNYYRCSNCKRYALAGVRTTYCARCGCKMD